MTAFDCCCGFTADDGEEYADHLNAAFDAAGDVGADGRVHYELAEPPPGVRACACGLSTASAAEFDGHLLAAFIPPDRIGADGQRHASAGTPAPAADSR